MPAPSTPRRRAMIGSAGLRPASFVSNTVPRRPRATGNARRLHALHPRARRVSGEFRPLLAAIFLLLTLTAGAQNGDTQRRYSHTFLTAIAKYNAGDTAAAIDSLRLCREIKPDGAEACYYLSKCYERQDSDSLGTVMLREAVRLDPSNATYKEALVPVLVNADDISGAARLVEDIVSEQPERTDMLDVLVRMYEYEKDWKAVLATLDRLETQEGASEELTMQRVRVYDTMGDTKQAEKALRQLVKDAPLELGYRVSLGNYLLRHDRKKEALSEYRAVLSEEPDNEDALMSMMDYYHAAGLDSLATEQRDRLLLSPRTSEDTRLLLLKQAIRSSEQQSTDSTAMLRLFDRILATDHADISVMELKLAYMQMKKMPADSIHTLLTAILDRQPEHAAARFELIQQAWAKGDHAEMVRLARPAEQYNPDEWAFSYFLGVGLYLGDDKEGCVKALERAASHVDEKEQKNLAVEMYALLGDALHATGRAAEAYAAYDNCLRLDPEKAMVLNNYAYYLSEENHDLDRAAAMSLKTIKAEPTNATYLDTYAWILFQQARYEEARIYIDMAVEHLDPNEDNTVVLSHQKQIEAAAAKP